MKPCISQATTLSTPFEADVSAYARGGWTAVELNQDQALVTAFRLDGASFFRIYLPAPE